MQETPAPIADAAGEGIIPMPINGSCPGAFVEEAPRERHDIVPAPTSITAFIGRTRRGPLDTPVPIASFAEFARQFGGLWQESTVSFAVQHYFLNGGADAIIVRVHNPSAPDADDLARVSLPREEGGAPLVIQPLEPGGPGAVGQERGQVLATGGWDGTCTLPGAPDLLPATIASAGFPIGAPVVPTNVLNRIVAIRIGLVVRSDEPDLKNVQLYTPPAQINDPVTGALVTGTRQQEFLFNCPANTNAGCPNRVAIPRGAAAPNIMLDGWRYRTYEAVVPLRNSIFNATIPPPT